MGIDLDRLALRSIITAGVLEFSNQLLLLRVDRNYWLIGCLELPCLGVDVLELCVAVSMVAPVLQSSGSAVSRTRRAAERNGFGSRAGFACRQSEATINKREAPVPMGDGESQGPRFRLNNRTYIETCDLRMPKPH